MTMTEKFALRWTDFQANTAKAFSKLRNKTDYYDVTLVSDDLQTFHAHKVVLSACSLYFDKMLKTNMGSSKELVVCLENIDGKSLSSILDYIYHGEVQIPENQLEHFLKKAQRLLLEGLSDLDNPQEEDDKKWEEDFKQLMPDDYNHPTDTKVAIPSRDRRLNQPHPTRIIKTVSSGTITDLDQHIETMYSRNDDGLYCCNECGKTFRLRGHIKEHVESHIDGLSYPCHACNFIAR